MADIDLTSIILFIVSILLLMFIIYIATRLVTREEVASARYLLRLFVTALIMVIMIPFLTSLLSDSLGMGDAGILLAIVLSFLILVAIIRYVVVSEVSLGNEWAEAIVITVLCIVFNYFLNAILGFFGQRPLFSLF